MAIGLKRGFVELADHDAEWEILAAETIRRLLRVFGSTAKDIQHVGSTAIIHIKAKPIIDIAVAVDDFAEVEALTSALESAGFLRRHWEMDEQMLFAVGDYSKPDGVVTHFIHVVKTDSTDWHDYINFRNYLNTNPSVAKTYETLKVKLATENPHDKGREKYLAGKYEFIKQTLQDALVWSSIHDIPGYDTFVKIEPVNKGLSNDKKYYIETADSRKLLLRVSEISEHERKRAEYERMQRMDAAGVPLPHPVEFGICNNGKNVYQLTAWCDGENLETTLLTLPETEQYILGLKAGEILRKIHSVHVSRTDISKEDWNERYSSFIDESIRSIHDCGVQIDGAELIINYYNNNRYLLKTRPQCYIHGDYHAGNMMLSPEQELAVIDWEIHLYNSYGDPWKEISMQETPHFSTGMIRGYFGGEPPEDYWRVLAFYTSIGAISSIPWAYYRFPDELESRIKHNADVLKWFDNMNNPMPTWYLKNFYIQWTDCVPYKLKAPFDFSFLSKYGKVFKVFDGQDSGNICFGVADGDKRYFVKFAGAPTDEYTGTIESAVERLKAAVPPYQDLAHPALIRFIKAEEIGGGFAIVFDWVDAVCAHRMYPLDHQKFKQIPLESRVIIFEDILDFHRCVAEKDYTAVDFYDGSIMWDFGNEQTVICDIDFYTKEKAYGNKALWGHMIRTSSPEERVDGVLIDEISNVYNMGAIAFVLFTNSDRSPEAWPLSPELYAVAKKAVSDERDKRQQSIKQLITEWRAAR